MFGINSIIANHFEMFFGYMDDKLFDKFNSRNGFGNELVIFMTIVVKGDIFTVIIIDARVSNNRPSKISANVFNSDIRSAKISN